MKIIDSIKKYISVNITNSPKNFCKNLLSLYTQEKLFSKDKWIKILVLKNLTNPLTEKN